MKIKAQYIQNGEVIKEVLLTPLQARKLCRATGATLTKSNTETNPLILTWGIQIKLFMVDKKGVKYDDTRSRHVH